MTTRCFIGITEYSGYVSGITCATDGYPEYTGAILVAKYQSASRVRKLIRLGNIYFLGEKLEPNSNLPHTKNEPQKGVTVAYSRDILRCPIKETAAKHKRNSELDFVGWQVDWVYLFNERLQRWYTYQIQEFKEAGPKAYSDFLYPIPYKDKVKALIEQGFITKVGKKTLDEIEDMYEKRVW